MGKEPNTPPEPTASPVEPEKAAGDKAAHENVARERAAADIATAEATAEAIAYGEAEHARLIGLLEKATLAISRNDSASKVDAILLELSAYTMSHFREEERLMAANAFPGLEAHKREHAEMAGHLHGLMDLRSKMEVLQCSVGVLALWIDAHLRITDSYFFNFLQSKAQNESSQSESTQSESTDSAD